MAYTPTTFVDRSVQYPGRRVLTPVSGQADTVDVTRAEGTVFNAGTEIDADNLNAEFNKIKVETDSLDTSVKKLQGTVVWTNPSPTSSFSPQTITLSSMSAYTHFSAIFYEDTTNTTEWISGKANLGKKTGVSFSTYYRKLSLNSAGSLVIEAGYNGAGVVNNVMIPYQVIAY